MLRRVSGSAVVFKVTIVTLEIANRISALNLMITDCDLKMPYSDDLKSAQSRGIGAYAAAYRERFPGDFLLELEPLEWEILRSQFVTLRSGHGRHRKYLPLAFTEHGAIMAAMVLNSPRAVQMSVYVVRAFVKLREVLASNTTLARRLETLERSVAALDADTRKQFDQVYEAILGLMGAGPRRN
jgi:hypothetical protein